MKNFKSIFIIVLAGITIFSLFKYIFTLKEKYALQDSLSLANARVASLENEKQNLLQTLEKEQQLKLELQNRYYFLKNNLKAGKKKMSKLRSAFLQTRDENEKLVSQTELLKAEITALRNDQNTMKYKLDLLTLENEKLKNGPFSREFKKAIVGLKDQVRKVTEAIKGNVRNEDGQIEEGNRGYLIRDGKLTYPARVRIEVNPASQ